MKRILLASILFAAAATAATLNADAQYAAGVTYTVSHITFAQDVYPQNPTAWVSGSTFSLQLEEGPKHVKFGFDARGSVLRGNGNGINTADYGFRLAFPVHHLKPYGEVLLGYVGAREGSSSYHFTGHVDAEFIAGLDIPLHHHLDLRAVEFTRGAIFGGGEDNRAQIASGLLVRF
jgi:hypothetical protein